MMPSLLADRAALVPFRAQRCHRRLALVTRAAGFGSGARKTKDGKAPPAPTQPKQCPCGSGRPFGACCEPFHLGKAKLPSAEAVLRARYSAYSKGNVQFLADTYHPEAGKDNEQEIKDLNATCRTVDFCRLAILDKQLQPPDGLPEDRQILEYRFDFKVINQRGQKQRGNSLETKQAVDLFGSHQGDWLFIRELEPEECQGLVSARRQ